MTAGIPQAIAWDPDGRTFDFAFSEDPAGDVHDPTIVFVPAARRYPGGFVVDTTSRADGQLRRPPERPRRAARPERAAPHGAHPSGAVADHAAEDGATGGYFHLGERLPW